MSVCLKQTNLDHDFQVSRGYTVNPCLKRKSNNNNKNKQINKHNEFPMREYCLMAECSHAWHVRDPECDSQY